jgi:hypothetical protein
MRPAFQVGDRVKVPHGAKKIAGVVIEDRGKLGYRGRHIYGVRVWMDPFDPISYEVSEEELDVDTEPVPPKLDKAKVIEYLKNAGLLSILDSNVAGGKLQPRVWLCHDTLGNVIHTFYEERGGVGGETVPVAAVAFDRIVRSKRDKVLSFLQSFGLNQHEAEDVVSAVKLTRK